ncbi:hypothetical protein TI04_07380 [Achromatium sp. WMS2]|nr:hypothetical protein TI04_07380 [Achromatium sp. WMS2]
MWFTDIWIPTIIIVLFLGIMRNIIITAHEPLYTFFLLTAVGIIAIVVGIASGSNTRQQLFRLLILWNTNG